MRWLIDAVSGVFRKGALRKRLAQADLEISKKSAQIEALQATLREKNARIEELEKQVANLTPRRLLEIEERILHLIALSPSPLTKDQIRDRLSLSDTKTTHHLEKLSSKGFFEPRNAGERVRQYVVSARGIDYLVTYQLF